MNAPARPRADAPRLPQLPAAVVLFLAALGLGLAALDRWRTGSMVVAVALLLAAGLRLTLPTSRAGWLVVRSRAFDAAFLLTLGFGLVVLANTIPVG